MWFRDRGGGRVKIKNDELVGIDTAVLIRRASMSRVKSATRPSIIKTGKKMSNKNKRQAGKKKGRDKGVKKKKKRDESATER